MFSASQTLSWDRPALVREVFQGPQQSMIEEYCPVRDFAGAHRQDFFREQWLLVIAPFQELRDDGERRERQRGPAGDIPF